MTTVVTRVATATTTPATACGPSTGTCTCSRTTSSSSSTASAAPSRPTRATPCCWPRGCPWGAWRCLVFGFLVGERVLNASTESHHPYPHTTAPTPTPLYRQLRVSWRTTLGEAGTLLSPRVLCSAEAASAPRPVELRLEAPLAPPEAGGGLVQGEVYTARCALANNTERDLWLQVQFHLEAMQGVYVTGKAFQNAGLVPARSTRPLAFQLLPLMAGLHEVKGSTRPLAFQLLPLMAGLHEVKGVTIVDLVSAQEFHQDRLCEVMLVRREDGEGQGAGLVAVGSGLEHVLGSN